MTAHVRSLKDILPFWGQQTHKAMVIELSKRQAQITELLQDEQFLNVDQLANRYQVTTQTIRRDLNLLCDHGLARRRHGGIEKPAKTGNIAYRHRQIIAQEAKKAIALEVAKHISNDVSVAFSIGTTPEVVADALTHHQRLRIFTNNLNVALLSTVNPTFNVNIMGGVVRNSDCDVLGNGIEKFFSAYLFDFGIYGVAGVGENGALLDFTEDEVRARQLIQDNSQTTFLVLDDTKFTRKAHVRGGQIGQATKVFCNGLPPSSVRDAIASSGSELIICGENQST